MSLNNYKTATIVLVGAVVVVSVILGIVLYNASLHSHGQIKTVGCAVFFDVGGTQPASSIDWGILEPNTSVNVTLYVKNTGNVPINWTSASSNWSPPSTQTYITVTVDFKGAFNTPPNTVIPFVITESISPSITGITTYSYDITITASG